MALQDTSQLGYGGTGIPDTLPNAITELKGLKVSVVAGAGAATKINIAAIRQEDTLAAVLEIGASGGLTDRLGTTTLVDVRATGTLTLSSTVAENTATVNGKVYTFKASPTAGTREVAVGGSDTLSAANLAAKINEVEGYNTLFATPAAAVVTIKAVAEGAGGNALTIVGGANVTASGATLINGTSTGGISITGSTSGNSLAVIWFDKR